MTVCSSPRYKVTPYRRRRGHSGGVACHAGWRCTVTGEVAKNGKSMSVEDLLGKRRATFVRQSGIVPRCPGSMERAAIHECDGPYYPGGAAPPGGSGSVTEDVQKKGGDRAKKTD
jgi:hypothetical protein